WARCGRHSRNAASRTPSHDRAKSLPSVRSHGSAQREQSRVQPALETSVVSSGLREDHLDPEDVAAYVDKLATAERRALIEAHLAECAECRAEVSDSARIIGALAGPRRTRSGLVAAAAIAAALLLFVRPGTDRESGTPFGNSSITHREAPVTTTVAPV